MVTHEESNIGMLPDTPSGVPPPVTGVPVGSGGQMPNRVWLSVIVLIGATVGIAISGFPSSSPETNNVVAGAGAATSTTAASPPSTSTSAAPTDTTTSVDESTTTTSTTPGTKAVKRKRRVTTPAAAAAPTRLPTRAPRPAPANPQPGPTTGSPAVEAPSPSTSSVPVSHPVHVDPVPDPPPAVITVPLDPASSNESAGNTGGSADSSVEGEPPDWDRPRGPYRQ